MSKVISFSDGFTSSSAPIITGGSVVETFTIGNTISGGSLLTIDKTLYKTYFVDYELRREDVSNKYIQSGSMIFVNNGTNWSFVPGNYTGTDMVKESSDTIANPYEIKIIINTSTGVVTYDSGTMGAPYSGTLKLSITRISV